jgi:hypothetical protein
MKMRWKDAGAQGQNAKNVKKDYLITTGKSIFFQKEKVARPKRVFV